MRILSSAAMCRRVARRMSLTTRSAGAFVGPDFCLIFAPSKGYDEPEILPSSTRPFCLTIPDGKQRIILANESDLLPAKQAAARETDASLYQVEISVAFEPDLHRPIRLERIAPSYRYNQYLAYDALGINCGTRRRGLVDTNVLETTSLPTYYQPSIRQFDVSSPPEFEKLAAADGGLD